MTFPVKAQPVLVLYDCPACERGLVVRVAPESWEHGVEIAHRGTCGCGEKLTTTVRVTREASARA